MHAISPTGVAVLLLLALVIDYMSIGPNSIRDRIAFLIGLVAIHAGFSGSPLYYWTIGSATTGINTLKGAAGGAYIAGFATQAVLSAAVGVLAIYTVGALLPEKAQKRVGRFATIKFKESGMHRINGQLWILAILLGLLANLPGGAVGHLLTSAITMLTHVFAPLPNFLFGA